MQEDIIIVAVSDDLESSKLTLSLRAIPCVGIHPWEVERAKSQLSSIEKLIPDACCIGEVGLDKRFVKDQKAAEEVFLRFLEWAREYDKPINLHALDAWRDVYDLLIKYDIKRAYFHWYNGPLNLIDEIVGTGYLIGINAALKIQKKHMKVLEATPLSALMTESDAPYNYRGLRLTPSMIRELVHVISKVKKVEVNTVREIILSNLRKFLGNEFENCIKRIGAIGGQLDRAGEVAEGGGRR